MYMFAYISGDTQTVNLGYATTTAKTMVAVWLCYFAFVVKLYIKIRVKGSKTKTTFVCFFKIFSPVT